MLPSRANMGQTVAAWFLLATATAGAFASPREVVQRAVVRVVEVLDVGGQASPSQRGGVTAVVMAMRQRAQIRAVADELFDFQEVARRALSVHWAARTPAERSEFVALFTDLLERTYIGKIEAYAGERIVYTGEKIDGNYAIVQSRIVPRRRADSRLRDTALEYRLLKDGNRWKVYDVIIDGVSFVSTYRGQFDRIIKRSSYTALMERMRDLRAVARTPRESP